MMQNDCLLAVATQPFLLLPACCFKLKYEVCILDTFILPRTIGFCFTLYCYTGFHFCNRYIVLYKYATAEKTIKCHSLTLHNFYLV